MVYPVGRLDFETAPTSRAKMRNNSNMAGAAIWLGVVLLIGHELDAVAHHEWRLLPGLSSFEDGVGRDMFVLLHIPLLAIFFWLMTHPDTDFRDRGRSLLAGLLIIHAGLHFILSGHELYEFEGIVAHITIYGAALAAVAYLALRRVSQD